MDAGEHTEKQAGKTQIKIFSSFVEQFCTLFNLFRARCSCELGNFEIYEALLLIMRECLTLYLRVKGVELCIGFCRFE